MALRRRSVTAVVENAKSLLADVEWTLDPRQRVPPYEGNAVRSAIIARTLLSSDLRAITERLFPSLSLNEYRTHNPDAGPIKPSNPLAIPTPREHDQTTSAHAPDHEGKL